MRPPDGYAETPEGLVYFADGLHPVARWDGIAARTYPVGVKKPAAACTLAKDASVLDPRPAAPLTACTLIKDPAAAAPSVPSTPTAPSIAKDASRDAKWNPFYPMTQGGQAAALKGTYRCSMRYQDSSGNFSPWSAVSADFVVTRTADVPPLADYFAGDPPNVFALKYTGVPVPTNKTIVRRQIALNANMSDLDACMRTTPGVTANTNDTYYLDLDTTDLTATTLISNETIERGNPFLGLRPGALRTVAQTTKVNLADTPQPAGIVGAYYAYVRYIDDQNRPSALSPISAVLPLAADDYAYGFKYTSVPVSPDAAVVRRQILRNAAESPDVFYVDIDTTDLVATTFTSDKLDAELITGTPINPAVDTPTVGLVGDYSAYVRFVNERGSYSDLSPLSNVLSLAESDYVYGVTYSAVPVPTEDNVVKRQILRNTSGQASTYYVDIETTDLVTTTFSSAKTDSELSAQTAVPLFASDGGILANTRGVPPSYKTVMAHHSGRMFLAVDRVVSSELKGGGVTVTNGSTAVTGVNTAWTSYMAGRFFWVKGATRSYEIASVDATAQTLVLTEAYADSTNAFGVYAIRPAPAERRLVYYTQPGEPESWPSFNALELQEDGDELTGLMQKDSFIYFIEAKHIYRFTFQNDPAVDGYVYLGVNRGCVNNRCWVLVDGMAYMLDYSGVHAFDGSEEAKSVSDPIQTLFYESEGSARIHWPASELFHAANYPDERIIRWFVAMAGEYAPRHALCYAYDSNSWWIEEYDRPVGSSATGTFRYRRRVFAGSDAGLCLLTNEGRLDGIDPSGGTTRGRVTSASLYRLTDDTASWPDGLAGRSVTIASGKGVGQRRRIVSQSGTTIQVRDPWAVLPDETSVYQLGGIGWEWKSGWMRFVEDEEDVPRKIEVLYQPTRAGSVPATMRLRTYKDFEEEAVVWDKTTKAAAGEGFSASKGSPDLVADMSQKRGFVQQRMGGHKELNMVGSRYIGFGLAGVASEDEQAIYHVAIDGARG